MGGNILVSGAAGSGVDEGRGGMGGEAGAEASNSIGVGGTYVWRDVADTPRTKYLRLNSKPKP